MNLYKFYFKELSKPIEIEANSKSDALVTLERICSDEKYAGAGYQMRRLVNESVTKLLDGISTKAIKGSIYVWSDTNGWQIK